jgi:eukaryotic-like serine/threonine-protein kinase
MSPAMSFAPVSTLSELPLSAPVIGGCRIVRHIARSDCCALYLAECQATGAAVALKMVRLADSDASLRFRSESRAVAALDHPGIVRCLRFGDAHSQGWLVLDWLPGTDLRRYAQPQRLLPQPVVLEIAARIADALAHAHDRGVVHRDLKPANVRCDLGAGRVTLTDFGSAWLADAQRTRSGLIVGTPQYMAPEQLAGAQADRRGDLYALGVVLYELLTGTLPFSGESIGELLRRIAHEPVPDPRQRCPDLPPLLVDVLTRLLAKQASQRHTDGHRLAIELRTIARGLRPRSDPPFVGPSGPGDPRHNDCRLL